MTETDLESVTSVKLMRKLFNNYELDTMTNEFVTPLEKKEENDFVDAILGTSVIRHAMSFLQQKGSSYLKSTILFGIMPCNLM